MFPKDGRANKALDAAKNPRVGDYWHEMFMPAGKVVEVSQYAVVVIKPVSVDKDHWRWDKDNPIVYTRKQFANAYRYGRVGDDDFEGTDNLADIKNRFWADVR